MMARSALIAAAGERRTQGVCLDPLLQADGLAGHKAGLGLAFCRKVMDTHKGYLWAESVEGSGSTFYLLFPLVQPE